MTSLVKKYYFPCLLSCLLVAISQDSFAAEPAKPLALASLVDTRTLRNPFIPALPKSEKEIEKSIKPPMIKGESEAKTKKENEIPAPETKKEPLLEIAPPKFTVSGLVWGNIKPQAILNDKIVSVGDVVEGSTIVDIRPGGIDVVFSGVLFTIRVEPTVIQAI